LRDRVVEAGDGCWRIPEDAAIVDDASGLKARSPSFVPDPPLFDDSRALMAAPALQDHDSFGLFIDLPAVALSGVIGVVECQRQRSQNLKGRCPSAAGTGTTRVTAIWRRV